MHSQNLIYSFFSLLTISIGCTSSRLEITDEYVEVSKPGGQFGLIELEVTETDSTFGYPVNEKPLRSITVANRKTGKRIDDNASLKIYFSKRNPVYVWRIRNDIFLADYIEQDTIQIKPKTWYRLSKQRGPYNTVYFYWNGNKGSFVTIPKPDPGAY